jgi:hypothetical protein
MYNLLKKINVKTKKFYLGIIKNNLFHYNKNIYIQSNIF